MPPHDVYVEAFLGDAAVMRAKRPARVNIGIDRDPNAPGLKWMEELRGQFGLEYYHPMNCDALEWLSGVRSDHRDPQSTLIYCDPPYKPSTRTGGRIYEWELDTSQHRELLKILVALPCKVMLSGYDSILYREHLAGWTTEQYDVMTRGGTPRVEWLWYNFPPPVALHDYSYLGRDFRERERIKRKMTRWKDRLRKMPLLERQAMLAAMEDVGI